MDVSATEFKRNTGKYLDAAGREDVFILRRGKVVARVMGTGSSAGTFGVRLKGEISEEEAADNATPYPFMTLNDGTEIVHSRMKRDGRVKVYIEKPDAECGFRHAICWLPGFAWEDVYRFTDEEIEVLEEIVRSCASLIVEFSQEGGIFGAEGDPDGSGEE